jgi:DNA-binding MarR family transcriptional regulator
MIRARAVAVIGRRVALSRTPQGVGIYLLVEYKFMPESHPHIEALVRQLYGLGMVNREIGRHALAELGTQGFTALAVIQVHGPLRVSDVAQRLGVDLSVASRQIASLTAEGYVERRIDASDRRAQLVAATPAGRQVLRESHRRMVAAFTRVLDSWTDEDVDTLTRGLERLRDDYAQLAAAATSAPQEAA